MCFMDMEKEKVFDKIASLRKVIEWWLRKKGEPEIMVRAVMSPSEGAKTRVRVGFLLSKEFPVKVGVTQGSVLSQLLFAIVVDVLIVRVQE